MRVLLIESETEDALFLRDVLTEIGEGRYGNNWVNIEVLHASSWKEASTILSNEPVDIALLELARDRAGARWRPVFSVKETRRLRSSGPRDPKRYRAPPRPGCLARCIHSR